MAAAIGIGVAALVASTEIGSGDYGQWLMTSRPDLALPVPAYRNLGDVPPLVPALIAAVGRVVPDPFIALQTTAVGLLLLLAAGVYLAASASAGSRLAGVVALALAFLATDGFTGLFAFGGLLQAAALAFMLLAIAAFARAPMAGRASWVLWVAGSLCLALAALSHLATGALAMASGGMVALASVARMPGGWRARLRELVPIGVCLIAVGTWWVIVLLPSAPAYVDNPASLNYRGPDQLVALLVGSPATAGVVAVGSASLVLGLIVELVWRRCAGPFLVIAAWTAAVGGACVASVAGGAATDYPRFLTPLLAPLVVAAAAGIVSAATWAADALRRRGLPLSRGLGLVAVTLLVLADAPSADAAYREQARGYQLTDQGGLSAAAAWINTHIPENATVLATARAGKWLEGLTGRPSLFNLPTRYSFQSGEWARSVAADVLLRSDGALTNGDFVVRFLGGGPCGPVRVPDTLAIDANHHGEYIDLLTVSAADSRIMGPGGLLATVGNLPAAAAPPSGSAPDNARGVVAWSGERMGADVTFHEAVSLLADASTTEVDGVATSPLAISGLATTLRPASGVAITGLSIDGSVARVTFTQLGQTDPVLRISVANGGALRPAAGGGIEVESPGPRIRLLVTDMTASSTPIAPLGLDCPAALRSTYGVGAAVITRDGSFAARASRMRALALTEEHDFGAYALFALPALAAKP